MDSHLNDYNASINLYQQFLNHLTSTCLFFTQIAFNGVTTATDTNISIRRTLLKAQWTVRFDMIKRFCVMDELKMRFLSYIIR